LSHDSTLEPVLRAVQPAVRLVHERHLRQILHFLIDRGRPLPTNTDLPYWLTRADLAAADVLPRETLQGGEPRLLLVTDPGDRLIADHPREFQLRTYWRALYRAAVMNAVDLKLAAGALTPEACRERLARFGPAAAREIRFVLESEHLVAPGADDADAYRTFAAVYLDLDHFTAHGAEEFFPALPRGPAVRAALAEDVGPELLAASRPAGAADPERESPPDERSAAAPAAAPADALPPPPGGTAPLLRTADAAEQKGNVVRAAILRAQAAGAAQGPDRERAAAAALAAVRQLVDRLGDMLGWDADTREEWRQALAPLLPPAARGIWPRAARCLYELQRIPADYARDVFAVDLPEYLRTLGRRPVRRHLPHAKPVLVLMAFRKAHNQLLRSGLGEPEQLRLDRLMHHEIHRREHAIRHEFTPVIVGAITAAGLVPANRVEEVARDKLVAELLDRVCARGYLRIGDLRDAVARNQLKLRDLRGPGEFVGGDALLRADTGLAYALDGVYRRGEFYLRWIQRFVGVFFGTRWGRALTLYLALPFGGAFLTLMFAEELRHMSSKVGKLVSRSYAGVPAKGPAPPVAPATTPGAPAAPAPAAAAAAPGPAAPEPDVGDWQFDEETLEFYWDAPDPPVTVIGHIVKEQRERASIVEAIVTSSATKQKEGHKGSVLIWWPTILGFGVFLLLVFHVPPFRRAVFLVLRCAWLLVRGVLWDVPAAVWRSRAVRSIRLSGTARFLHRHFATPLMLSVIALGAAVIGGVPLRLVVEWGWVVFVLLLVAYNVPPGWDLQDRVAEAISDWWRRVRVNLLPGIVGAIIDFFRALANWVERQLYAVDEWMRFRGGDSQGSLWTKALLGLVWFPVAYVFRFVFYLLVEPQVNPVKHFPVVTVSHKVIWPMLPQLVEWTGWSYGTVSTIINGIPGIFGFIAWELKENWRLYAANRAPVLKPVMIGSHGESMRGLLRPGFHSGTVPKLHRKSRKALAAGDRARVAVLHHDLEHAAEGVHRFAERELVPLLAGSRDWGAVAVEVSAMRFGVQRAEVEFAAPALGRDPFVLAFENVGGTIEAYIAAPGWADKLTDAQREVFAFALRGLLDMAAAARYDVYARDPDAPAEPGFGALTRRVAWAEWVARWEATKAEPTATAPAAHH
jgi:hypothetical protein